MLACAPPAMLTRFNTFALGETPSTVRAIGECVSALHLALGLWEEARGLGWLASGRSAFVTFRCYISSFHFLYRFLALGDS